MGFLAAVVVAGAIALLALLVVLHVLPTGLSPLRDPVSRYALTRYGGLYRGATIAAAVTGAAAAVDIALAFRGAAGLIVAVLLAVFAVSRLLIGFFPMDHPDAPRSATGGLHRLLALLAFGSVTVAAFVAGGALHDSGRAALATVSTVCGVVMAVGAVGVVAARAPGVRGVFGLAERLIYVGFIAWFLAVGISRLLA